MTSSTISTIPAVKAQLLTIFTAAVEEPCLVWRNRPNVEHQLAENVYVGDARGRDEWVQIGKPSAQSREEVYTINVDVEVFRQGTEGEAAEVRMWAIVGKLEEALLSDTTIAALAGVQWSSLSAVNQTAEGFPDGWKCCADFQLQVVARI